VWDVYDGDGDVAVVAVSAAGVEWKEIRAPNWVEWAVSRGALGWSDERMTY